MVTLSYPSKVGSAPTVITVVASDFDLMFLAVLGEQRLLCLYAAGFPGGAIILTEPAVDACDLFSFHVMTSFCNTHNTVNLTFYLYQKPMKIPP